jgi:hypothetical protein
LCTAHARRELRAVTDAAAEGQWCWAAQAAEALTAMQGLVREATCHGHDAASPVALAAQVRLFRSAALAGSRRASVDVLGVLPADLDHRLDPVGGAQRAGQGGRQPQPRSWASSHSQAVAPVR